MMMMMMMKNPAVLVLCTVLISSLAILATQSTAGPDSCCFQFIAKPLSKKKVVSYTYTNMLCPVKAVVFKMASNHEICADPSQEWVKRITVVKKVGNRESN
ncbi:monocyte chemotactic protein 1B-like [Echeneis naucrates]|nr:monocyte chemotactic protein 1B-like [Echeneis naucrates]